MLLAILRLLSKKEQKAKASPAPKVHQTEAAKPAPVAAVGEARPFGQGGCGARTKPAPMSNGFAPCWSPFVVAEAIREEDSNNALMGRVAFIFSAHMGQRAQKLG